MSTPLKCWALALVTLFTISVVTLSLVQTRILRRYGWFAFYKRGPAQLYWRELSPLERWLIWPGLGMFFITWLAAMILVILRHIGAGGTPHI